MPAQHYDQIDLDALDPERRKQVEELIEMIRQQREHYGLPPEPLTMPTREEQKAGDRANVQRLIQTLVEQHHHRNDLDDWFKTWYPAGIHDRLLPEFAYFTVTHECWEKTEEQDLIHNAWTLVEWPAQIGVRYWREMFARIGFWCNHDDRHDEPCPTHPDPETAAPLTVWRGSFAADKRGLSWTLDRERAEWFVRRGDMAQRGRTMRLWRCEVPADRQYGHFHNRREDEIVADVRGLRIESED